MSPHLSPIDRTTPPPTHEISLMPIPDVTRERLSNGIELVSLHSPYIDEISRITLSWNGGSLDSDSPAATQLASMLCKTGSKIHQPNVLADLLDYNGAWLSSELTDHNNTLTLFSLNRTIDPLLDALTSLINSGSITENEFVKTREKLAASRATALEQVSTQAKILDARLTFGTDHPMTRYTTPSQIRNTSLTDVITTCNTLKGKQAPVAYVVGNLNTDILSKIKKHLSNIDCDNELSVEIKVIPPDTSPSTRVHHEMPDTLQSAITVSIPTVNRAHHDYESIRFMTMALGGYFGSRLMSNVREKKGLTYGINAGVYGHREGAFITIACQCDNRYTEQVIDEIEVEIHELCQQPMSIEEFTAVKQYATTTLLSLLDTPFNIMDYYISQRHLATPPDYFTRQQQALKRLTPESIMDIASKYLLDKPRLISTAGTSPRR